MAVLQKSAFVGRDFTADELAGKKIRIKGSLTRNNGLIIAADDEYISNVGKIALTADPDSIVEVKLELCHSDQTTEEVTLRDNLEISISALVPAHTSIARNE